VQLVYDSGLYLTGTEALGEPTKIDTHGNLGAWLPGGRLASSNYDGSVVTMNADGSNRSVVFSENNRVNSLIACSDGVHLLLTMLPNKETQSVNIYSFNLNDGRATALTNGKVDVNPTCSPDSKWFVYAKLENDKTVLMRMNLDGTAAQQLSEKVSLFSAISPDGKQIAILKLKA
jgi:Tol biopolymer transport system component